MAIVDTGATAILLSTRLAEQIGFDLSEGSRRDATTVGGVVPMSHVTLEEVAVGQLRIRDVAAVCYDIPGRPVAALLGMSFLQHFRATLSVKEGYLELQDP